MASPSPGVQNASSTSPAPEAEPATTQTCRLCGEDRPEGVLLFGDVGRSRGLPEKCQKCLPVLITESDDLSKFVCNACSDRLDEISTFFDLCQSSTKQQVIHYRKTKGSPLDLDTHINQYVRSFNPPVVPHIKLEPTSFCDVDLDVPGYEDQLSGQLEEDFEDGDIKPSLDDGLFKIPILKTRKRKTRRRQSFIAEDDDDDDDDDDSDEDWENPEVKGEGAAEVADVKENVNNHSRAPRKKHVPLSLMTCAECGESFHSHEDNLNHWQEKHKDMTVSYKCTMPDCKFTTEQVEEVYKHRKTHRLSRGARIKKSQEEAKRPPEECKVCGKFYPRAYLYSRHILIHSDRKSLPCGVCEKTFKTPESLRSHARTHIPDEERYTHCCELCGKRFTQRANLEAHLRVHSGYKPHSCDFCGKTFSQKGNMEEHRRTHTGEKPFVCEQCGAAFTRRSELQLHRRCVHTKERPYQCSFCPKNFQRRDLLKKHERIHTDTRPYSCQYCQKAFTQRDKMVVHTRLHTGERPYVCDVCGKGFCESGNLKKHMRVHGKEIPKVVHQNNKGKPAPVSNPSSLQKHLLASTSSDMALDLQSLENLPHPSSLNIDLAQSKLSRERQDIDLETRSNADSTRSYTPHSQAGGTTSEPKMKVEQNTSTSSSSAPAQHQQAAFYMNLQQQQQQQVQQQRRPIPDDDQSDTASERSVTPAAAGLLHAQAAHYVHPLVQHIMENRDWPYSAAGSQNNS